MNVQTSTFLPESKAAPRLVPANLPVASPPTLIIPAFGPRLVVGMIGVLTAVVASAVNYYSTDINMRDIQGALMFSKDEAAWARGLFEAGMVIGMTFAPWCLVTFSLKRLCLFATTAMAVFGALSPIAQDMTLLYALRIAQGLSGGLLTPILITVALRYCPRQYLLFGFAAYALSSNFGPNMSLPIAAWSSDYGGLFWIFWNIVPFCAISLVAVTYGIPQDAVCLERFKNFDYTGVIAGSISLAALVLAVSQGDRLNWFASPLFCVLLEGGGLLFCFFLFNEWFHPAPILNLRILARRNFLYSVIAIFFLVVIFLGVAVIPIHFLSEVKGYRPLDVTPIALIIALPQLATLPLVSALLKIETVDCRIVSSIGLGLVCMSCYLASSLNSEWIRDDFYFLAALLALAEAMAILPILMTVVSDMPPQDGPYVSAMFNAVKGFASVFTNTIIEGFGHHRAQFHSSTLISRMGHEPLATEERLRILDGSLADSIVDGGARAGGSLEMLAHQVHAQSFTLAMADLYRLLIALSLTLIVITMVLPNRVKPPCAAKS